MVEPDKWDPIDSLGATGEAVARNIKRLRTEQGLTYARLSELLGRLARPIPTLGLRKIESGGRRVDADDLLALAVVLRTAPVTLLMPDVANAGPEDRVEMTGTDPSGPPVQVPAQAVWEWLTAQKPIIPTMDLLEFGSRSWPKWVLSHVEAQMVRDRSDQEQIRREAQMDLYRAGWVDAPEDTDGDD